MKKHLYKITLLHTTGEVYLWAINGREAADAFRRSPQAKYDFLDMEKVTKEVVPVDEIIPDTKG